jgi:hypothetical protein
MIRGLLGLPGEVVRSIFGGAGQSMPPSAAYEDAVDDQAGQIKADLDTPRTRTPGTAATTLGGLVHAYAAGDRQVRDSFDVGRLPDHVAIALLTMKPADLMKLAAATPEACGRWALGQRSGIVGIPACQRDWLPAVVSVKTQGGEQAAALGPAGERPSAGPLRLVA